MTVYIGSYEEKRKFEINFLNITWRTDNLLVSTWRSIHSDWLANKDLLAEENFHFDAKSAFNPSAYLS